MADWYVSTSGNDSTGDGSIGSPYATLTKAQTSASNGDTVYLKSGETWTPSTRYTISKQLNFDIYGGTAYAVIDGTSASNIVYQALFKVDASYVTVNKIRIYNSQGTGIALNGSYSTVSNCEVDTTYDAGILIKGTGNRVSGCRVTATNNGYANASDYPAQGYLHPWAGVISFNGALDFIAEGNIVDSAWGEGIALWYGAKNGVVRNNRIHAAHSIGIYLDSARNIDIYNNLITGTTNTDYHRNPGFCGAGIVFNNEQSRYTSAYGGYGTLGPSDVTSNVNVYNNLVAFTEAGLGIWGQVSITNYENVNVFNNTFVGYQIAISKFMNAENHNVNNVSGADTYIQNNIWKNEGADSTNTISTYTSSRIHFDYNAWNGAGGIAGANDVAGSITLAKNTGWQSLSVIGDVTSADFICSTAGISGAALSSILSGQGVTTDHDGTTLNSPPDLGGLVYNGSGGTPPPSSGGLTVNGDNVLVASSTNTATGSGLSGVSSILVLDSDDTPTQATTKVIVHPAGASVDFLTGDLASISTTNFKLRLSSDTPDYFQYANTTTWSGSTGSCTTSAAAGIDDYPSGINIISAGETSNLEGIDVVTATAAGEQVKFEIDIKAGTSTSTKVTIQRTGGNKVQYTGTIGGTLTLTSATGHSNYGYSWEAIGSVYRLTIYTDSEAAGVYRLEIGPNTSTSGNLITLYMLRAWLDQATTDTDYIFSPVSVPTITNINTDNEVDPNAENLITGTDLQELVYATITDADTTYTYQYLPAASDGLTSKFRAAELTSLTAPISFTGYYAESLLSDHNPRLWTKNYSEALVDYAPTVLGLSTAITITSGGATWNSATLNAAFTGTAGQLTTIKFLIVQGTSGRFRAAILHTSGAYIEAAGIVGSLAITGETGGTGSSVTETQIGSATLVTVTTTLLNSGEYKLSVGPYHTSGDVHFYGVDIWHGNPTNTVTHVVTVASTGTPEPTLVKKIKFSVVGGNQLMGRAASAGAPAAISEAISIVIGGGNPRIDPGGVFPNVLAYANSVLVSDGELELIESDLDYGSIDALLTGSQGYYMWAKNSDGSLRWSAPVQVIEE